MKALKTELEFEKKKHSNEEKNPLKDSEKKKSKERRPIDQDKSKNSTKESFINT